MEEKERREKGERSKRGGDERRIPKRYPNDPKWGGKGKRRERNQRIPQDTEREPEKRDKGSIGEEKGLSE